MDITLLATLKQKLIRSKNFTEIWDYFFDHFGEDSDFIALGDRTHHPLLEAILAQVGRELFGKPVPLTNLLLTRLAEYQFIHGGCTLNGRLANVMYFEDIRIGLLAVVMSLSSSETRIVRFTGLPIPASSNPSQN